MAVSRSDAELLWSEETFKLASIIKDRTLPVAVKIDEGVYELTDGRFTPGDQLHIHCKKTVTKVVGHILEDKKESRVTGKQEIGRQKSKYEQQGITIPIKFQQKVKIYRREAGLKVYTSISQLIQELPKYVRVIEGIVDNYNNYIKPSSEIELLSTDRRGALICLWNGVQYTIDPDEKCRVLLVSDDTEYTLSEVIDRYSLPLSVIFLDESVIIKNTIETIKIETLSGKTVKLESIFDQDVIIGSLNPVDTVRTLNQDKSKRAKVIIPLKSITASELDLKVPLESKSRKSGYQIMLTKHSLKTDEIDEVLEATIDSEKYPQAIFIPYNQKTAPPIPPKGRKAGAKTKRRDIQRSEQPSRGAPSIGDKDFEPEDEYEYVGPPRLDTDNRTQNEKRSTYQTVQSNTSKHKAKTKPPPSAANVDDTYSKQTPEHPGTYEDEDGSGYEEIKDVSYLKDKGSAKIESAESIVAKVPQKVREGLLRVQNELLNFVKRRTKSTTDEDVSTGQNTNPVSEPAPKQRSKSTSEQTDEPAPEDTPEKPMERATKGQKFFTWTSNLMNKIRSEHEEHQATKSSKQASSKEEEPEKRFAKLNVEDLASYLERCGLRDMAATCRSEKLNGAFFSDISDNELKETFLLNRLQIMKFTKMKTGGWEPTSS